MGREVRRVPIDWEHPRNDRGHYQPLFDESYDHAIAEWIVGRERWLSGEDPSRERHLDVTWEDWNGGAPDAAYYRPEWTADNPPVAYQIYETVSEGTPMSPVLPTREALIDWLMDDPPIGIGGRPLHLSREQAERFVEAGSAPSMVFSPSTGLVSGMELS